jgi:hypothetical protein
MKPARCSDHISPWAQPQVIRVAKDYLCVEIFRLELFKADAFDSTGSAHRHKDRRLDLPATGGYDAGTSLTILSFDSET